MFNSQRNLEKILENRLLDSGEYDETEVQIYKNLAKEKDTALHEVLIDENIYSEYEIKEIAKKELKYSYGQDSELAEIPEKVINILNRNFIEDFNVLPFKLEDDKLHLVSSEPQNLIMIDQLRNNLNLQVELYFMMEHEIKKYINYIFADNDLNNIMKEIDLEDVKLEETVYDESIDLETDETATIKLVNGVLNEAIKTKASDIHIEPLENFIRVRLRVDGDLRTIMDHVSKKFHNAIISRIKIMSDLIIVETRKPQGGRFTIGKKGKKIHVRSSFVPTQYGEKCVLRLVDSTLDISHYANLGFKKNEIELIKRASEQPKGMIIIVGPTGSGKTTTLYSILNHVNQPEKSIFTVEDPIERRLHGVAQTEVNHKIDLTFPKMLKELLRQDPDIIMIGEMRDLETAQTCSSASSTGHLVLSSLHANDTVGTISRLEDMGVENYKLADNISLIISQTLIKKPCRHCSEKRKANEIEVKFLREIAKNYDYKMPYDIMLTETVGCQKCFNTGYDGRFGIFEILEINQELRKGILDNIGKDNLYEIAKKNKNFRKIQVSLLEKVINGDTTLDEFKTKVSTSY